MWFRSIATLASSQTVLIRIALGKQLPIKMNQPMSLRQSKMLLFIWQELHQSIMPVLSHWLDNKHHLRIYWKCVMTAN